MVKSIFAGYHATVFAYGQTGTGKTYTMEGYKYSIDENGVYSPILNEGET